MSKLHIIARYQIHPGQLEAFKKVAKECLAVVKAKDTDTLQYDSYFNESQTECIAMEAYPDSSAVLVHLGNLGDLLGKLMAISDFSAEIYGNPSEELQQAITGLDVTSYTYFQGLMPEAPPGVKGGVKSAPKDKAKGGPQTSAWSSPQVRGKSKPQRRMVSLLTLRSSRENLDF